MKKVNFQNDLGLFLSGYINESNEDSNSIILMVHGLADDKSEKGRFDVISLILDQNRYNVMRFDLSGHGESDNYPISLKQGAKDVRSALEYLKGRGYNNFNMVGYCSGGTLCLENIMPEINSLFMIAPLTDVKEDFLDRFNSNQIKTLKRNGFLEYRMQSAWRDSIVISHELLHEIVSIDQERLMSYINIPSKIIHGTDDKQIPLSVSERALELIGRDDSELKVIYKMDHSFLNHINEISENLLDWLNIWKI